MGNGVEMTDLQIIELLIGELVVIYLGIRIYFNEKLRYQTNLLNVELKKNQNEKEN